MGVEQHLQALAVVGHTEEHATVAQAEVGDLDLHGHSVQLDPLMAPIELVRVARVERERNVGRRRLARCPAPPLLDIAADAVIAAGKPLTL